jgi:5-methylcytosine-specific restriction enzyme subunit McrC
MEKRLGLREEESAFWSALQVPPSLVQGLMRRWPQCFLVQWNAPGEAVGATVRSRGYVGNVLLASGWHLEVTPKTSIENLFALVEYAWDLPLWDFGAQLNQVSQVEELYEFVAEQLADGILDRLRYGLSASYLPVQAEQGYVRGKALWGRGEGAYRRGIVCSFHRHSSDTWHNQLLMRGLQQVAQIPFRHNSTRAKVRRALRDLGAALPARQPAAVLPFAGPSRLVGRAPNYDRINQPYKRLHALCRFILDNRAPASMPGNWDFPPCMLYMPGLFEHVVAAYVQREVPLAVRVGWRTPLSSDSRLSFVMDIALFEKSNGKAVAVLDCKYKRISSPDESDIQQVVAYATKLGCRRAFLVYPESVSDLCLAVGDIKVQAISFDLGKIISVAGAAFLQALMEGMD